MTETALPPPAVYRINLEQCSHEELISLYAEEILMGACTSTVESAMVEYITRVIEPVGWTAVWRATKRSSALCVECDFLVEVLDVSLERLQATVVVMELIDCSGFDQVKDSAELQLLMNPKMATEIWVPLIELYPISEGDEDKELYLSTAVAIEHVRCFYKYIWRPWDEDDDDDIFSEKYLSHRLKFFLDLKNKVIPESMAMQAETILQEGWRLREQLDSLTRDMQASDSEQELDEDDVSQVIQLRFQLEELQKQMEIMENPFVRTLALTKDAVPKIKVKSDVPVVHIVGKSFTFQKITELALNASDTLEFHHNLGEAIASVSSGDTILILPGIYKCGTLGWLEDDITIKGMGDCAEDVMLEGQGGSGDFFVNCNSSELRMENLMLRPSKDARATIMVHKGKLAMINCSLFGASSCLILLPKAEAELTSCNILYAKVDGIELRLCSSLVLNQCTIHHCRGQGILINSSPEWHERQGQTILTFNETKVQQNHNYDVLLDCHYQSRDFLSADITWDTIHKVNWLKVNIVEPCELGILGLQFSHSQDCQSSCPDDSHLHSPPGQYSSFLESVNENHWQWSKNGSANEQLDENNWHWAKNGSGDEQSEIEKTFEFADGQLGTSTPGKLLDDETTGNGFIKDVIAKLKTSFS